MSQFCTLRKPDRLQPGEENIGLIQGFPSGDVLKLKKAGVFTINQLKTKTGKEIKSIGLEVRKLEVFLARRGYSITFA